MFSGSIVALITPFRNGIIDEEAYRRLIEFHIENGTSAVVPVGTTGESATLSIEEHNRVIEICVDAVKKRVPVIAGTGGNSTWEAVELTRHAKEVGADATLSVTPYYNKPSQEGLYQHFTTIVKETALPMVLYNVPGRTSINLLPETVARLAEWSEIVAIKEASGSLSQMTEIQVKCGDKIVLLSGDDAVTLPLLSVGGKGVISVVANIVPRNSSEYVNAWLSGDHERARDLFLKLFPLCQAMFIETNPVPVKTALAMMGWIEEEFRLPLCPMAAPNRNKLAEMLRQYKLL